jgi:hypothetical protein
MRFTLVLVGAVPILLGAGCASVMQTGRVYKHPSLNVQFTASSGWEQVPRAQEPGVYEAVDPQSEVHVVLWKTETQQDALAYLLKMADMKGLAWDKQPEERSIGARDAWVLDTAGSEEGAPVHTLLGCHAAWESVIETQGARSVHRADLVSGRRLGTPHAVSVGRPQQRADRGVT